MDIKETIASQYYASLEMLKSAAEQCPDALWIDDSFKNPFWHIAYHTLFFTHLYLQESMETFTPWDKHRDEYQFMGTIPFPPHRPPKIGEPYSKDDVLEYLAFCQTEAETKVPDLNLEAESGFYWYPYSKLEMQFINIRHIQHHAAQLIERLRNQNDIAIDWVGGKPNE